MSDQLHRTLLKAFRRLPRGLRVRLVRLFSPSFTVGAIAVVERPDGALLLVRQVYRPRWGLPGGLLERGEDPADAARREVYEEVGLPIDLVGDPAVVVDPVPQRVDVVFRARPIRLADLEQVRPTSAEIAEVRWFAPDRLPELQREAAEAMVTLARRDAQRSAPPDTIRA